MIFILFLFDFPSVCTHRSPQEYSCVPLHMDEQRQDDQLEPIYNSSVPIQDIALVFKAPGSDGR